MSDVEVGNPDDEALELGLGAVTLTATVRVSGEVSCTALAGSRLVAAAGRDLTSWRWNPGVGWVEEHCLKRAHAYPITAVAWCEHNELLASCGVEGSVRLWSWSHCPFNGPNGTGPMAPVSRGEMAAGGAEGARALAWACPRLAVGHDDGTLRVWDATKGVLVARVRQHAGSLRALCVVRGVLLAACTEAVLKLYDIEELCACGLTGEVVPLWWEDDAHDMGALCADGSATAAVTGGHDGKLRVWSVEDKKLRLEYTLEGHSAGVTSARWAGGVLASCSLDGSARLWARGAPLLALPAHPRYVSALAVHPRLAFIVTGSNDKSLRTWSLGSFSIDSQLEPSCSPLAHFGLGDLEGIGAVEIEEEENDGATGDKAEPTLWWSQRVHSGPINCLASSGGLLATASSEGEVKVFEAGVEGLRTTAVLREGRYPATAVDFDERGAWLVAAGLDGLARVYDTESWCIVRTWRGAAGGAAGAVAGGGGVRGAALRAAGLLLAGDDGQVLRWDRAARAARPHAVDDVILNRAWYGFPEGASCVAWAPAGVPRGAVGGAVGAAAGGAAGELRLLAPEGVIAGGVTDAHDLGVQSVSFSDVVSADGGCLLASAGSDGLVKLWDVYFYEDPQDGIHGRITERCSVEAHGGGAACVRWARGGRLLASCGGERWARVWTVTEEGLTAMAALPVQAAGGAAALAFYYPEGETPLLAVGSLSGDLSVWNLPPQEEMKIEQEEELPVSAWSGSGVRRWIREYLVEAPGSPFPPSSLLTLQARAVWLTGAMLLNEPIYKLLQILTEAEEAPQQESEGTAEENTEEEDIMGNLEGEELEEDSDVIDAELVEGKHTLEEDREAQREHLLEDREAQREHLLEEIAWLRCPLVPYNVERLAACALRCPLSHGVLREPARAPDGYTYERRAVLHALAAPGGRLSPMTGRPIRGPVTPNYGVLRALRAFLREHGVFNPHNGQNGKNDPD